MKYNILTESGQTLGTIDISPERAAEIAAIKGQKFKQRRRLYFLAGDWLTDEEIEALGTSHELEVQIIAEGGAE